MKTQAPVTDYHDCNVKGVRTYSSILDKHVFGRVRKGGDGINPHTGRLVYSTTAARVNGYLDSLRGCNSIKDEVHEFGLSTERSETLLGTVCGRKTAISCKIG